jgi:hypothetical protein
MHLDPAPIGRRSAPVRERVGAMESHTEREDDSTFGDEYAGVAE